MSDSNHPLLKQRTQCPACGHTSFRLLHREPLNSPGISHYMREHYLGRVAHAFDGYDYELVECEGCRLAFQAHVPDTDLLSEIYDVWSPETERDVVAQQFDFNTYRYLSDQLQFALQLFAQPPHTLKVFDFGFGWSQWLKMASAYGCEASGCELSRSRIAYAKSFGFTVIDSNALPADTYHFINTEQVFEHLLEPGAVLRSLARAVKPGGVIKISVPDAAQSLRKLHRVRNFSSLTAGDIMAIAPFEHVNSFTHRSLMALGAAAALQPLRMPLRKLYNASSGWLEPKNAARQLLRPIYRHVYPRSTFLYFVRPH